MFHTPNPFLKGSLSTHIRGQRLLTKVSFCSSAILLTLAVLLFFPIIRRIANTEAATIPSDTVLTMASPDLNLNLDINKSDFATSTPTNFTINTNNYTGYTLTIAPATKDENYTKLINEFNTEYVFNSISSASTEAEFNAGNWGYLPSKLNGEANTKYQPAPDLDGTILDKTTTANTEDNNYSIALAAKITKFTPAGNYANSFTLTAVANPVGYAITYDSNTTDEISVLPAEQTGILSDTEIRISSLTPERNGYKFTGWCSGTVTTTNTIDGCSSTVYQPNDIYNVSQANANFLNLKAMWTKLYTCSAQYHLQNADGSYPSTYTDAGIIGSSFKYGDTCSYTTSIQNGAQYVDQTRTATITNNTTLSIDVPRTTYQLTFANTTYAKVTSGSSGKYRWGQTISIAATYNTGGDFTSWTATAGSLANASAASTTFTMPVSNATVTANGQILYLQNMAASKCITSIRYAYDNRDNELYGFQKLADGKCWMLENLRLGGSSAITLTTANTNSAGNFTLPASVAQANFKEAAGASWTSPQMNNSVKNTTTSVGGATVKMGNYYNVCAMSAGTYCVNSANSNEGTISYDICPKSWRLPTGVRNTSEFDKLYAAYSNNYDNFQKAVRVPLNGCLSADNSFPKGSYGCLWSSTKDTKAWSGQGMVRTLFIDKSKVQNDTSRHYYGQAVRCLMK